MEQRRVVFRVGVTYDTPLELLAEIPQVLRSAVGAAGNVKFDRAHLAAFGDFSILFETVFYVMSSDYNIYMDVQQAINLTIKREFDRRGVDFAFPTQTLHISTPEIPTKR
jgi:small-conductance mechanosensitive channel